MKKEHLTRFELLYESLSEEAKLKVDSEDSRFPYIFFKALNFIEVGPLKYRTEDFFNQPITNDTSELALIQHGVEQLILGKGLCKENPFTKLDVLGFSLLMGLFHFESIKRSTTYRFYLNEQKGILDEITFQHLVEGSQITLFNFI
jgi:hypothetical protein